MRCVLCLCCACGEDIIEQELHTPPPRTTPAALTGSMASVGKDFWDAKEFEDAQFGDVRRALYEMVMDGKTPEDMQQYGQGMAYGKFSLCDPEKGKAWNKPLPDVVERVASLLAMEAPGKGMEQQTSTTDTMRWTTNFCNLLPFAPKKDGKLNQDAIQAIEHPHLGKLHMRKHSQLEIKVGEALLVTNVPRLAKIDIKGVYGNALSKVSTQDLKRQVTLSHCTPPTQHNILVLAVPEPCRQSKFCAPATFQRLFWTAYCGYKAAYRQSAILQKVAIETGNWGSGSSGRIDLRASALAQMLAATIVGVHKLHVYPFTDKGLKQWQEARKLLEEASAALEKEGTSITPASIFMRAQLIALEQAHSSAP